MCTAIFGAYEGSRKRREKGRKVFFGFPKISSTYSDASGSTT